MINYKWLDGNEDLKNIYKIREEVFIKEQGIKPENEWNKEIDLSSKHLLIYEDGKIIGTARLFLENDKCTMGKFALIKEARSKGYGKITLKEIINKAKSLEYTSLYVYAQYYIKGLYESLGFKEIKEPEIIDNIKQVYMKLEI